MAWFPNNSELNAASNLIYVNTLTLIDPKARKA